VKGHADHDPKPGVAGHQAPCVYQVAQLKDLLGGVVGPSRKRPIVDSHIGIGQFFEFNHDHGSEMVSRVD
jgi:hypothetical protein